MFQNEKVTTLFKVSHFTYSSSESSDLLEVNWLQSSAAGNVSGMILAIQRWGTKEMKGESKSMMKGTTLFERQWGKN